MPVDFGPILQSGAAGVVGGAIVLLVARLFGDRAQADRVAHHGQELEGLKNEYSRQLENLKAARVRELEEFRASVAQQKDAVATAIGALAHGYAASHEKVLDAYGELWVAVLRLRDVASPYLFPYMILVPEEYSRPPVDSKVLDMVPDDDRLYPLMSELMAMERQRYLFGEDLWRLYWVYRSFAGRIATKVMDGRKRGFLPEWDRNVDGTRDTHRDQILRIVFTEAEIQELSNQRVGTPGRILEALEIRILRRMNEWLLGRDLLNESLARQQQVATQLRNALEPLRPPLHVK